MKIKSPQIPVGEYAGSGAVAPPVKMEDGTRWYCPSCGIDLFGIMRNGSLHVKYKERSLLVDGVVRITCRACGVTAKIATANMAVTLVPTLDEDIFKEPEATAQARKCALEMGIDLATIEEGTGRDGRITTGDVRAAAEKMANQDKIDD